MLDVFRTISYQNLFYSKVSYKLFYLSRYDYNKYLIHPTNIPKPHLLDFTQNRKHCYLRKPYPDSSTSYTSLAISTLNTNPFRRLTPNPLFHQGPVNALFSATSLVSAVENLR